MGIPALALACGMKGVHGTHEQLAVADLVALTDICLAVARRMAEQG
jgi:di/tripeptidase